VKLLADMIVLAAVGEVDETEEKKTNSQHFIRFHCHSPATTATPTFSILFFVVFFPPVERVAEKPRQQQQQSLSNNLVLLLKYIV
jgi:hypothetical protein